MATDSKDLIIYGPRKDLQMPNVSVGEYCLTHLQKYGDKVAVVQQETGFELTFSDVLRQSKAVAGFLRSHGVGSGDTVMMSSENNLEWPAILIGTMFVGAALAAVNDRYSSDDMLHVITVDKPKVIISNKLSQKSFQDALSKYEPTVPLITWEMISSCSNDDSYLKDFHLGVVEDPDTHVALVICSSGSTGKPKGVEVTHARFLSMLYVEIFPPIGSDVEYTILNVIYPSCTVPLYMALYSLCSGFKLISTITTEAEAIIHTIQKYKVNMSMLTPHQIKNVLEYPSVDEYDLSSLSTVICAGSIMLPGLCQEAQSKFKCPIPNAYGLTECAGQMRPAWGVYDKSNTVGTLAFNMSAKVVDVDTGELLGPNCTGELCFKAWNVFKAYRGNPQATRDMFDDDGFFLSGDLGYYDNEGYFYVVDRIKEVFKYKFLMVNPSDIEEVLLQHPAVLEVAVVGIHHDADCAHARAFIVLRQGASATEDELVKLVQDKLPSYKWLYGGVGFLESLPRTTATRKVKKFLLRKLGEDMKMAPDTKDLIIYGPRKELQVPNVSAGEYCLTHLQKYGDKVAVVQQEDGTELTFSDVLRQSKAVAGFLREYGLGSADTVMVCCGTTWEYSAIMMGTMFVGAALANTNEEYSLDEMLHAIEVVKPQVIISNKLSQKNVQDALSQYEPKVPLITWEMISSCLNDDSYLKDFHLGVVEDPETHVALVMSSSGSTGKPKSVEYTDLRVLRWLYVGVLPPITPDADHTVLVDVPPCWTLPFFIILESLCFGYKLILSDENKLEATFKTIEKYKVNMIQKNPRELTFWIEYPSIEDFDLSSLSIIMSVGSAMSSRLHQAAQRKFNNCTIYNGYGLSECSGQICPAWGLSNNSNTVGKVGPNMVAKVVDVDTGELLGPNCTGELCFKSWNVFRAYRGNPQATRDMFDDDGFFLSGDLGYYDNEGYFYIVDRIKEVFKYNFIHVNPADIEEVLLQHPAVLDAAVVGIPHEIRCAHARAFIVLRQGASATEDELEKLVQDQLPSYKWLYGGVRFLESLPRTTVSSKVMKFHLRKLCEKD